MYVMYNVGIYRYMKTFREIETFQIKKKRIHIN